MSEFAVKWIYVLEQEFSYNIRPHLNEEIPEGWAFQDRSGTRWLEIYPDGTAKVLAQYAWDGCTPKFDFWDLLIGTPDGVPNAKTKKPKAYYASLMHDVLYQFLDADLPVTREGADKIFLELLTRDNFAPRQLYFYAVRIFGGLFRLFTRWKRSYKGKRMPV